jgi:hypothetical protein
MHGKGGNGSKIRAFVVDKAVWGRTRDLVARQGATFGDVLLRYHNTQSRRREPDTTFGEV